jgi:hypothetical protein
MIIFGNVRAAPERPEAEADLKIHTLCGIATFLITIFQLVGGIMINVAMYMTKKKGLVSIGTMKLGHMVLKSFYHQLNK